MPSFAANLSMLFTEVPFLERFRAARAAGFRAVEVQFPYAWEAGAVRNALRATGLELVLHNLPAGDWDAGERGIACHPGREAEFRAGVERALDYARALECPRLNCLAGVPPTGVSQAAAWTVLVENVRYAARQLADHGIRLLVEAINTRDVPGFAVSDAARARALRDEVADPNLWLQFDAYHLHLMEGDLAASLEVNRAWIGHVQVADAPGRHEPGTGAIDFPAFLRGLERIGYDGWVGCEYTPGSGTEAGLVWMKDGSGARVM